MAPDSRRQEVATPTRAPVHDPVADYLPTPVRETYVAAKPRASVGTRVEELIDYILEPYANATPTDRRSSTVFENATRIRNCRQELTRTIGATFRKIDDAMHSGDSALADMYINFASGIR